MPVVSDHARWARRLEAHWRQVREAGEPCDVDPFLRLLIVRTAGEFVGNWEALQALPPAREAINRLLLDWRGE